jgi:hypothetical protein
MKNVMVSPPSNPIMLELACSGPLMSMYIVQVSRKTMLT